MIPTPTRRGESPGDSVRGPTGDFPKRAAAAPRSPPPPPRALQQTRQPSSPTTLGQEPRPGLLTARRLRGSVPGGKPGDESGARSPQPPATDSTDLRRRCPARLGACLSPGDRRLTWPPGVRRGGGRDGEGSGVREGEGGRGSTAGPKQSQHGRRGRSEPKPEGAGKLRPREHRPALPRQRVLAPACSLPDPDLGPSAAAYQAAPAARCLCGR